MFAIFPNRFCEDRNKDTAVVKSFLRCPRESTELLPDRNVSPELSERRPEPAGTSPTQSDPLLEAPEDHTEKLANDLHTILST